MNNRFFRILFYPFFPLRKYVEPATAIAVGSALLSLGSKFFQGQKESKRAKEIEKAAKKREKQQEREQRRSSISRALGIDAPVRRPPVEIPGAPDVSLLQTLGGLGDVGLNLSSRKSIQRLLNKGRIPDPRGVPEV